MRLTKIESSCMWVMLPSADLRRTTTAAAAHHFQHQQLLMMMMMMQWTLQCVLYHCHPLKHNVILPFLPINHIICSPAISLMGGATGTFGGMYPLHLLRELSVWSHKTNEKLFRYCSVHSVISNHWALDSYQIHKNLQIWKLYFKKFLVPRPTYCQWSANQ